MDLNNFASQLEQANTERHAKAFLTAYLASYGIRNYAFTFYSGHIKSGRELKYHCVSNSLRDWHVHYLEQNYADVDRTLEESYTLTLPLFWHVQNQLELAKNKKEQRIREESIEFGIDKGLSLPVHGPNDDFVVLVLHQFKNENCLVNYQSFQFEWLSAAHIFYHYIKKILSLNHNSKTLNKLTRREEQCLTLTAKSWRVEQIAKELKISSSTVNFHIQNANKKLGTNNKYQSLYKYFADEKKEDEDD